MKLDDHEEKLLRSVTLQNAQAVFLAREKAERELRESNERISNILESISDALIVLDREWRFTYVNPQAEQILAPLNKTRAGLMGKNHWLEFPESVGTIVETNYRRAVAEKVKVEFENFYAPLNSWFLVRAYPSRDGLSVYFLDVTERKRGEGTVNLERRVLERVAVGATLQDILETLASEVESQSTDGMMCSILLFDETDRRLRHGAAPHLPQAYNEAIDGLRIGPAVGSCGTAAFERKPVFVRDIATDPLWVDFKDLAAAHGLAACCSTPMFSSQGRLLGTVAMYFRQPHNPSPHDCQLIDDATRWAGLAIERQLAQEALHQSQERFRAIVQATPECVKVVAPDGKLLAMNAAGCGMVEADSDADIIGSSVYDLIAPEFREKFIDFNESICQGNKGQMQFQITGLKGTRRWMETHAVPMRDPSTGQTVQLAVARDVTSRKEAEEKLRDSEEELRALANSIPQLAWMANPDGYIFWYNQGWYEYTGTTLEQMQGWGWKSVHDPETLPQVIERWQESLRTETAFEMEFPLLGADGVFRWFLTRIRPVRDPAGRVTRWFGTNTNIDEQRQLLRSLSEARDHLEKGVEERTAELKTANQSLRDLSARLMKVQDDERRRLARELHDSVGQILAALGMNLSVVQAQADKLDSLGARALLENAQLVQQASSEIRTLSHLLHPPLLEIAGLASAVRWYVDGFSERSNIKVDLEIPPDFGRLPDDVELAVFRIIQECLTNIHRHSEGDTAAISIRQDADQLLIRVQDNGKGIPLEKQKELIETSRGGVGFGGMRERLRQLGGTLEIQSNGAGTAISATLKVAVPEVASHG